MERRIVRFVCVILSMIMFWQSILVENVSALEKGQYTSAIDVIDVDEEDELLSENHNNEKDLKPSEEILVEGEQLDKSVASDTNIDIEIDTVSDEMIEEVKSAEEAKTGDADEIDVVEDEDYSSESEANGIEPESKTVTFYFKDYSDYREYFDISLGKFGVVVPVYNSKAGLYEYSGELQASSYSGGKWEYSLYIRFIPKSDYAIKQLKVSADGKSYSDYRQPAGGYQLEPGEYDMSDYVTKYSDIYLLPTASNSKSGSYKNVNWSINKSGVLTVSGSGEYADIRGSEDKAPWYQYRHDIKSAKISLSGTHHFTNMFADCDNLVSVDFTNTNVPELADMTCMFVNCTSLKNVDLSMIEGRYVYSMTSMFLGCTSLESVNLSNFASQKLMYMDGMFAECANISYDNISWGRLDTSQVKTMSGLFLNCKKISEIDYNKLNTRFVSDMSYMFAGTSITSCDLNKFRTNTLQFMQGMFSGCANLEYVNMDGISLLGVEDMSGMFSRCSAMTRIEMSDLGLVSLEDASGMFEGCFSLYYAEVNFPYGKIKDTSYMFDGCTSLGALNVSKLNTASVEDMSGMFRNCGGLTTLDLSKFNTSKVKDMSEMFSGCYNLSKLNVSKFNTSNVENMSGMFKDCSGLTGLDIKSWNTGKVKDMSEMFSGCESLVSINSTVEQFYLKCFNTTQVTNMSAMFKDCASVPQIRIGNWDLTNVSDISYMFSGCGDLNYIFMPANGNYCSIRYIDSAFEKCNQLKCIDLSAFDFGKVTDGWDFMVDSGLEYINLPRNIKIDIELPSCSSNEAWYLDGEEIDSIKDINKKVRVEKTKTDLIGCKNFSFGYDVFHYDDFNNQKGNYYDYSIELPHLSRKTDLAMVALIKTLNAIDVRQGWCFGVSAMLGKMYIGEYAPEQFGSKKAYDITVDKIKAYNTYYFLLQSLQAIKNRYKKANPGKRTIESLNKKMPCVMNFKTSEGGSHSILAYAYRIDNYNNRYEIYCADPSTIDIYRLPFIVYLDKDYKFERCNSPSGAKSETELTGAIRVDEVQYGAAPSELDEDKKQTRITSNAKSYKIKSVDDLIKKAGTVLENLIEGKIGISKILLGISNVVSENELISYYIDNDILADDIIIEQDTTSEGTFIIDYFDQDISEQIVTNASLITSSNDGRLEYEGASGETTISTVVSMDDDYSIVDITTNNESLTVDISDDVIDISSEDECTVYVSVGDSNPQEVNVSEEGISISPESVIDGLYYSKVSDQMYTGTPVCPDVSVYDGKSKLGSGTDYSLEFSNNINAGISTVKVKGKGNYSEYDTLTFNILKKEISDDDVIVSIADKAFTSYTGKELISKPVIKYGKLTLKEDKDYTVAYSGDKTNIGTVDVTITGINNFEGTVDTSYRIFEKSKDFSRVYVEPVADKVYTGQEIEPYIVVKESKDSWETLTIDEDYSVRYINNVNTGTATAIVTGINAYGGFGNSKSVTFKITPKNIAGAEINVIGSTKYTGEALKPEIEVRDAYTNEIVPSNNYTVTYANSKDVILDTTLPNKYPTVKITGKNNYTGNMAVTFAIEPAELTEEELNIVVSDVKRPKTSVAAKDLSVSVKRGKMALKNGKDYVVECVYESGKKVQTATIKLIGNYSGSFDKKFMIYTDKILASDFEVTMPCSSYVYTGNKITPEVEVRIDVDGDKRLLTESKDYKVTYSNNVNAVTSSSTKLPSVKVTGMGAFTGSTQAYTFEIVAKPLNEDDFILTVEDVKHTGRAVQPKYTLVNKATGKKLGKSDFTATFDNNIDITVADSASKPVITIIGSGANYSGKIEKNFRIYKTNISSVVVDIESVPYTGSAVQPKVRVYEDRSKAHLLEENTDYRVDYGENIKAGNGAVTIIGIGEYGGSKKVTFKIVPKWLQWLMLKAS